MMRGWTNHTGLAVALPVEGIDTDQLIPARFMSAPRSEGYGRFLLHDLRRDRDGAPRPDFALNAPAARGASILVARRNFGGGSSREAAVYALVDAGFRAVIAPSFGDIFAGNAVNNGLLPAQVMEEDCERLIKSLNGDPHAITIDLDALVISDGGLRTGFDIDPVPRRKLMNGWDDIDLSRDRLAEIHAFRDGLRATRGWAFPVETAR